MKRIIEEVNGEGLENFLGERITLFCCRYIYTGKIVGISDTDVKLEDCGIVYETGELTTKEWEDMQKLPGTWYVTRQSIESFGPLK